MQKQLEIKAVIGYSGNVHQGLILHPDNEHLIYPLGSTIVIRHILTKQQTFLKGHNNKISVIKVSPNGRYIASGQKTVVGFQADVLIWNFQSRKILHQLKLHKTNIVSLDFSYNSELLASQGGIEDKNMLIIWDVKTGKSMYGLPNKQLVSQIKFFNNSDNKLIAIQQNGVQILTIDKINKKIMTLDVNFGNVKRIFTCGAIDHSDTYAYIGTKSGDFYEINIQKAVYKRLGPVKRLFSLGIMSMHILPNGDIIIGAGDGKISKISIQNLQVIVEVEVLGGVNSITFTGDYSYLFCGTNQANIYWINCKNLATELRNTCHYDKINDIVFPANFSEVFATCSLNDIRIWNAVNRLQLLRIQVPNLQCNTVNFMYDGKSIISGWSDGKIRSFLPQSGKLIFVINDAHNHGVTAITSTSDCQKIISGGSQGQIRIWRINKQTQTMEVSLKQHKGKVFSIEISKNNEQAVSTSGDGSCIIWDIKKYTRLTCLFDSAILKQVAYHPEQYQLLTGGSDGKITYWQKYDGQYIRKIIGSEDGGVNTLAIMRQGTHFITGGEDCLLKIWGYDDGLKYYEGYGHSAPIIKIYISPDQKTIVSVGNQGAIFIWQIPMEIQHLKKQIELPTIAKQKPSVKVLKSSKSVTSSNSKKK